MVKGAGERFINDRVREGRVDTTREVRWRYILGIRGFLGGMRRRVIKKVTINV